MVTAGPDMSVRVVGDGPNEDSESLLADAGIDGSNFFLLDAAGEHVAVTLEADAGGHTCRNGIGIGLRPEQPLDPGTYTLVLVLEDLQWPLEGGAAVQSHEGKSAFVRRIEVTTATGPDETGPDAPDEPEDHGW